MKKQSIVNYTKQYIKRQQEKRPVLDPASWQTPEQQAVEAAFAAGRGVIIFGKPKGSE